VCHRVTGSVLEQNSSRTSLALSSGTLLLSSSVDGAVARQLAAFFAVAQSPQKAALTAGSLSPSVPFLRLVPQAMIRQATLPLVVWYSELTNVRYVAPEVPKSVI
jgi:hypothetical protein